MGYATSHARVYLMSQGQCITLLVIDIYSRVDGALAGLLARHLKSCDSVDLG
jgi:hypothetical protein